MVDNKVSDKPKWHVSYAIGFGLVFLFTVIAHQFLKVRYYILPPEVFWIETVLAATLVMLMIISMVRRKVSTMWWEVMLLVISFAGVWVFSIAMMPIWAAVLFASIITLFAFFWQNTLTSNLFYIFGSLGIGLLATWHFSTPVMIILAAAVLLYEVYRSQEMGMATLYFEARKSGLVPSILLPVSIKGWFRSRKDVWKPGEGMIVGVLPFMALAGLCFHALIRFSYIYFVIFCFFVIVVGFRYGMDQNYKLRQWVFLSSAIIIFTAIYFIDLL
jgi:hypothetical protein